MPGLATAPGRPGLKALVCYPIKCVIEIDLRCVGKAAACCDSIDYDSSFAYFKNVFFKLTK